MNIMLRFDNIYFQYQTYRLKRQSQALRRETALLRGLDFKIHESESVGLVGANGAGKTTLLKLALGLLRPMEGNVELFGADPSRDALLRRGLGYVSENQEFPDSLRVGELIELHRALYPTWDDELATRLMRQFGLGTRPKLGVYSKGVKRALALTCALAHRPRLLLLDEPASGLDPAKRREFLTLVVEMIADTGTAVLFSTHHTLDIERIANRLLFLEQGRFVIDEPVDSLREDFTLVAMARRDALRAEAWLASEAPGLGRVVSTAATDDRTDALIFASVDDVRGSLGQAFPDGGWQCSSPSLEDVFVAVRGAQS